MKIKKEQVWQGTIAQIMNKVESMIDGTKGLKIDSNLTGTGVFKQLETIYKNGRIGVIFFATLTDEGTVPYENYQIPSINVMFNSRIVKITDQPCYNLCNAYPELKIKAENFLFNINIIFRQSGQTTKLLQDLLDNKIDYLFVRNNQIVKKLCSYGTKENKLKEKIFSINCEEISSKIQPNSNLAFDNCCFLIDENNKVMKLKQTIDTLFKMFGDGSFLLQNKAIVVTEDLYKVINKSHKIDLYFTM